MGFGDSVSAQCERVLKEVNAKCYSIAWQLFTTTVYRTPSPANPGKWAKGLLANQWYPKEGLNFSSEVNSSTSPVGSASLSRITALSATKVFYGKDGAMTMANNVPYVMQAEYLGWAKTGPYRMVALSLMEVAARNR